MKELKPYKSDSIFTELGKRLIILYFVGIIIAITILLLKFGKVF